jgi:hypothetical protein
VARRLCGLQDHPGALHPGGVASPIRSFHDGRGTQPVELFPGCLPGATPRRPSDRAVGGHRSPGVRHDWTAPVAWKLARADGQGDEDTQRSGPICYPAGQTGVAFASSPQAGGCVVTGILIFVVGMAIVAGLFWVWMRMERSRRQRFERRHKAWRAGGSVGAAPGGCSGGYGGGDYGGYGADGGCGDSGGGGGCGGGGCGGGGSN